MDLSNILVISGKPALSELVSRTRNGAVVMNLVTKQKSSVFHSDRISALSEIRIFTPTDEVPLSDVLASLKKQYDGQLTPFDIKAADSGLLFAELEKAMPDYDRVRVHASDVKKLFSWYNILLDAGKLEDDPQSDAEQKEA